MPLLNKLLSGFSRRKRYNRKALNITAADLLRQEIIQSGISQKAIAEKLEISAPSVSQILNIEENNLTLNTIADIATVLNKRFRLTLVHDIHAPQEHKNREITLPESGSTYTLTAQTEAAGMPQNSRWTTIRVPAEARSISVKGSCHDRC